MSRRYPRRSLLRLAAAGGLLVALPRLGAAEPEPVCRVLQLVGEAWRDSGGTGTNLGVGDGLHPGDRLTTGPESKVKVLFVDGSALVLGPQSEIGIAVYDPEPKAGVALLLLLVGTVKVSVGNGVAWQSFQVQGGTAVASVRGTEWAMQEDDGGSAVFVIEGSVEVRPRLTSTGGSEVPPGPPHQVVLQAGEGTDVAENTAPTPPKVWGAARRDKLLALLSLP